MRFLFVSIAAACVFSLLCGFGVAGMTAMFGKPSRGVGYGIGVTFLWQFLSVGGLIILLSCKWLNRLHEVAAGMALIAGLLLFFSLHAGIVTALTAFGMFSLFWVFVVFCQRWICGVLNIPIK